MLEVELFVLGVFESAVGIERLAVDGQDDVTLVEHVGPGADRVNVGDVDSVFYGFGHFQIGAQRRVEQLQTVRHQPDGRPRAVPAGRQPADTAGTGGRGPQG